MRVENIVQRFGRGSSEGEGAGEDLRGHVAVRESDNPQAWVYILPRNPYNA